MSEIKKIDDWLNEFAPEPKKKKDTLEEFLGDYCRSCGGEIELDITNPKALCEECEDEEE
jgi:hypothetical protein